MPSTRAAIEGIEAALAAGTVPKIFVTLTRQNLEHLPELLAWTLAQELKFGIEFLRPSSRAHVLLDSIRLSLLRGPQLSGH